MVVGATLISTSGWTGIGAAAGTALFVNGAATATQGIGKIYNSVTNTSTLREDNIVKTGVQDAGAAIGGNTGSDIAGAVYDIAITTAGAYAGSIALDQSISKIDQIMPKIIDSKIFSARNGYGVQLGKNIEMFYRNPNAKGGPGGTLFSYKGSLGKFRIDWDPAHGFHCHPPGH